MGFTAFSVITSAECYDNAHLCRYFDENASWMKVNLFMCLSKIIYTYLANLFSPKRVVLQIYAMVYVAFNRSKESAASEEHSKMAVCNKMQCIKIYIL